VTLLQTELLARLARQWPDGVAWRNLADGSALTLGAWHRASNRLAHGLAERGVRPGDRVALVIGRDEPLEWLVSYVAIHKARAVAVPLHARLGPGELARIVRYAAPVALLCSEAGAVPESSGVGLVAALNGEGAEDWGDLFSDDEADLAPGPAADDVADILYTSGTTGEPKGVTVTHAGLSSTERVPSSWLGLGFLSSSPFATTSGSLLVCGPLRGGLSGWFLPRFDPDRWLAVVEEERPVAAFLVPAMVELIVSRDRFETADLSSLAAVNIGSAPIATATLRRFGARLPAAEVLCGYGMTEFGAVTAVPPGDGGRHLGSVGVPLPGVEVRILGADGAPLGPGQVGQVAVAGTRRPRAYHGDGDATARTWVDGWLLSGDLGSLDADGHLWITGRQKEMVIRGGHNIVPGEVEAAFFEHPEVTEAAVAGVPHPVLGEDVAAWVVLRRPVAPEELRAFLLARLADYKVPRRITVIDALPRNESGKVLKSDLVRDTEQRSGP
jgi:acyl-CoA synthetase (AMP-forming)/AMP-acid ligase II